LYKRVPREKKNLFSWDFFAQESPITKKEWKKNTKDLL